MPAPKAPVSTPVTFSFDNGEIQLTSIIDPETKQHLVTCDLCSQVIKVGIRGSIAPISEHRDSVKCKRKVFNASKLNSKNRNLAGDGSLDDLRMVNTSFNTSFASLLTESVIAETWPCPGVNIPWSQIFITKEEEKSLGILEHDTVNWRRQNNIPDSDGVELGQTRKRSDTVSTANSDSHDQKRSRLGEIQE